MPIHLPAEYYRLIGAIAEGNDADVQRLLPITTPREFKGELSPPVWRAARLGRQHMLQQLLEAGWPHEPFSHSNPLRAASERGHTDCVETLLRYGHPINGTRYDVIHPVEGALRFGHVGVAQLLLDKGAAPVKTFGRLLTVGGPPIEALLWAVQNGWADETGESLVIAVEKNEFFAFETLLALGVDPHLKNSDGVSALARIFGQSLALDRPQFVAALIPVAQSTMLSQRDRQWLGARSIPELDRHLIDLERTLTAARADRAGQLTTRRSRKRYL